MTTAEPLVCHHCKGSGREIDRPHYRAEHHEVLNRLAELGAERAPMVRSKAYTTTAGRTRYNEIITEVRALLARGYELDVWVIDMQHALGVTSPAYYKIKNGQTAP